jgi:hypothetical protein
MSGLQPHHVAGILGNLWLESGGFRAIREYGKGSGPQNVPPPAGTHNTGYGWVQWTNSRLDEFLNYCKQNNHAPQSDEANFGFFMTELKNNYNYIIVGLKQNGPITMKHAWYGRTTADTSTVEGATAFVMMSYERPALGVCALDRRIAYAKQILAGMGTGVPQRGATTGNPKNGISNK